MSTTNKKQTAASKVREFSAEELCKKLSDNRKELLDLSLRSRAGQVQNPIRIRTLRRENARILMVLGEKAAK
ncbi:MAG: 50S ribosomal protein L29 [Opitutales bacterium]|nr:50S ribosomal protein L29 [Opitutales bacterium]